MNSKDRMAAAMGLCEPDRVPVMCQLSLGYYFLNSSIPEIEIWHSTDAFGEALMELQRERDHQIESSRRLAPVHH